MECKESDKVLAFDMLYTSNPIAKLKILLFLFDEKDQQQFVVLIKYLEFQYALSLAERETPQLEFCSSNTTKPDLTELLDDIKLYCSPSEKEQLDQIGNLQGTMSMMKDMQSMMGMMEGMEGMSEGLFNNGSDDTNSDMIKSMLSPEQLAMFEMFKGGF